MKPLPLLEQRHREVSHCSGNERKGAHVKMSSRRLMMVIFSRRNLSFSTRAGWALRTEAWVVQSSSYLWRSPALKQSRRPGARRRGSPPARRSVRGGGGGGGGQRVGERGAQGLGEESSCAYGPGCSGEKLLRFQQEEVRGGRGVEDRRTQEAERRGDVDMRRSMVDRGASLDENGRRTMQKHENPNTRF